VVDGVVLREPPLHSIANGSAAGIDLLIGTTRDEVRYYAYLFPYLLDLPTEWVVNLNSYLVDLFGGREGDLAAQYANTIATVESYLERRPGASSIDAGLAAATDVLFRVPSIRLADAQRAHDPDVWMWRFDWGSPIDDGIYGAMHAVELPFVFGNLAAADDYIGDDPPKKLMRRVQRAWISFAYTGDPNTRGLPNWPRYGDERETMLLDVKPTVANDPDAEDRAYWDGIPFDGVAPAMFDIR
jgi:para-nitrobenzyl esterase